MADDVVTGDVSVGDDGNGSMQEILKLNNNDDKGKTLVTSEIYTTNGVQGQLANIHTRPYRTINSNGSIDIKYQELKTDIKITPTIVKYNTEKQEESHVKLDVELEVGAFVNVAVLNAITTTKKIVTTRILKANGKSEIVGSFITDLNINTKSGTPLLSKIPLLKYLFFSDSTTQVRNIAMLTLAVRILPIESQ